ncbi:MAG: DMT family transporter [Deltaproteobacteria bacterium]
MSRRLREASILLLAPLIWGVGFVATREQLAGMTPLWANALRFGIAAAVLLPISIGRLSALSPSQRWGGLLLGVLLFVAFSAQTAGLALTTVSRSSFLTGLYAVLTPLFALALGKRVRRGQVVAIGLAFAGLWLLARPAAGGLNPGDLLTLGCAAATACQILLADVLAQGADPLALNGVQMAGLAICALAAASLWDGVPVIRSSGRVWEATAYLAILSSVVAFTLQLRAQKRLPPTAAAMIFLLEAPFGALAGRLMLGERLDGVQGLGCGLILGASAVAVLWGGEPAASARQDALA